MKRIALPLFVSVSLLAAPVSAQNISVDGLVSACWLEPSSCVSLLEVFIGGLDPNDDDTQITLGVLAERLYETGLNVDGRDRRDFSRALARLSRWMKQIKGSRANEVLRLADRLVGGKGDGNNGLGEGNGGQGEGNGNGGGNGEGNGEGGGGEGDGNGGGTGEGNGGGNGQGGGGNGGGNGEGDGNGGGTGEGNGGGNGQGGGSNEGGGGEGDGNGGGNGEGGGGNEGGGGEGDGGGNEGGDDDEPIEASPE